MEEEMTSLGDRMKYYESLYDNTFSYNNVFLIRLDGNKFSKRTKQWKLHKPFDGDFHWSMLDTCKDLINSIPAAKLIWTGSDEITILCHVKYSKEGWFNNRLNKVLSLSASICTASFNRYMYEAGFNVAKFPGFFDSRIITVPNMEEAINNILSRYNDCKKNSISMWADSVYSHKELLNKNSIEKLNMLMDKGIDWENDEDQVFNWSKYGTFIYKESVCFNKENNEEVATGNDALKLFELVDKDKYYIRNKIKLLDLTKEYSNMYEKVMQLI